MNNILFPIETLARELDYRLLLAAKVLGKGRRVYICNHRHLDKIMLHFQGGTYVGKHVFPNPSAANKAKQERYQKVKNLGINVVYIHEEGAIFQGTPDDWEKTLLSQCDPRGFDSNDRICVWGKWQQSVLEKAEPEVSVRATGHPRFDLYKRQYRVLYSNQVEQLRRQYGDFILVNGNYGHSNCGGRGIGLVFSPKYGYDSTDPEKRQKFVDFYARTTKSMVDMISLVHRLSTAFPDKQIIYRSHPSESDELYKHVFKGLRNVKAIHEGAVGPWLLAAETIIHDGCTTAIEASFSDAHIINYGLNENEENDIRLPSLVGQKAMSQKAVIEAIRRKKTQPIDEAALKELGSMIENYHNDSFNLLSEVIDEALAASPPTACRVPSISVLKREYAKHVLKKISRKPFRRKKEKSARYNRKKFPGFELGSIQDKICLVSEITNTEINLVYANPLLLVLEGR